MTVKAGRIKWSPFKATNKSHGDVDAFFFFQAEDGIRDWTVTGVQTCALPILRLHRRIGGRHQSGALVAGEQAAELTPRGRGMHRHVDRVEAVSGGAQLGGGGRLVFLGRSGERRGGEEGRSRWAPDHLKKKQKKHPRRPSLRSGSPRLRPTRPSSPASECIAPAGLRAAHTMNYCCHYAFTRQPPSSQPTAR